MAVEDLLYRHYKGYSEDFIVAVREKDMPEAKLCLTRAIMYGEGLARELHAKGKPVSHELLEGVVELLMNAKRLDFKIERTPEETSYFAKRFPQEILDQRWKYLETCREAYYKQMPEFYQKHDKSLSPEGLVNLRIKIYRDMQAQGKFPKAFENQEDFNQWIKTQEEDLMDSRDMVWFEVMENEKLWNPEYVKRPGEK